MVIYYMLIYLRYDVIKSELPLVVAAVGTIIFLVFEYWDFLLMIMVLIGSSDSFVWKKSMVVCFMLVQLRYYAMKSELQKVVAAVRTIIFFIFEYGIFF
jgi:hypothetical protein